MVERRQNILPAISDDLLKRVVELQELYQVDGEPMSFEMLLDLCLTAYIEKKELSDGE